MFRNVFECRKMLDIIFGKYHGNLMGEALEAGEGRLKGVPFRRRSSRLKLFLALVAMCAVVRIPDCLATSIEIDLGAPGTLAVQKITSFDQLNNAQLGGQSLSLDFTFSSNEFVRLFSITSPLFSAVINLQINGAGQLGFLQGTGHLVDINGQPIPGFGVTGNSSGAGLLSIGLFPLLKDQNGTPNKDLARPLDFFGIDFDLTLPNVNNPSIHITGADFGLFSDPDRVFGIGPDVPRDIVPDNGHTAVLLTFVLCFLGAAKYGRVLVRGRGGAVRF
jgi:hypothetical protein